MLKIEIAQAAIALINRAQISAAEAEATVQVKQAILAAAQPQEPEQPKDKGSPENERADAERSRTKPSLA